MLAMGPSVLTLVSGGVDSAVLAAELLRQGSAVHPLYVQVGLAWERVEREHLERYLAAIAAPGLHPLKVIDLPVVDIYGSHWSVEGGRAPTYDAPDEEMHLPGRNLLLLAKAAVYCALNDIDRIALGLLAGNPFADATPEFFAAFERSISLALGRPLRLDRPFAHLRKADVVQLGRDLPLHLTFSCVHPAAGRHCGDCNKCAERQRGFREAGVPDHTDYATRAGARRPAH